MYATLSIPSIHTLSLGQPPWQQELHKAFLSVSPTPLIAMDEENPHDGPGLIKLDMTLLLEVFLDCVSGWVWGVVTGVVEVKVSYSRSLEEFWSFCWGFFAVRWMFQNVPDMYRCVDAGNKAVCDKMTYSMYLRTEAIQSWFSRGGSKHN